MRIQDPKLDLKISRPPERSSMYASALDPVRCLASELELQEQKRCGGNREDARARMAHFCGLMPGTLYNLARNRLKKLDDDLRNRLIAYAVKDLEREIALLEHRLAVARALGSSQAHADFCKTAKSLLARAQTLCDEFAEPPK